MWRTKLLFLALTLGFADAGASSSPLLDAVSMRDALDGLDHLYHARTSPAALAFERIRARHPESPAPDFLLGGIDWHNLTTGPSGFEAGGPAETAFHAHMDAAIRLGEAALKRDENDASARFFLGGAYGYKARYAALKEKWWDAYRTGRKGVKHLERVVEQRPDLADAYLGLGIYHYYSDVIPSVLKLVGGLVGIRGDRERGLEEIHRALTDGVLVPVEARFFLAEIYVDLERDAWAALGFSRSLRDEFPENELFVWMNARVLDELHLAEQASAEWSVLQAKSRRPSHRGFLRYRQARSALFGGDFEGSAAKLSTDLQGNRLGSRRITMWGRIRYGVALDFLGHHDEALDQYRQAKTMEASSSAEERASHRLAAGRRDPSVVSLRELAEVARILKGTRRHDESELRRIEDAVTRPARGLSSEDRVRYFAVLHDLAHARLARGNAAGCLAAIDRAFDLPTRCPKEERSRFLILAARAQLRLGDREQAMQSLSQARARAAYDEREGVEELRTFVRQLAVHRALPDPIEGGEEVQSFRVPDRGEILVQVEGDFLPEGQRLPLSLIDGFWEGNFAAVPGRPLRYRFVADGQRARVDENAETVRWEDGGVWCYREVLQGD